MKMCVIIEEFLYAKKIENQTQRTLRGYKNTLNLFASWLEQKWSIDELEDISVSHLKQYVSYHLKVGHKGTYVNGIIKILRAFFKYTNGKIILNRELQKYGVKIVSEQGTAGIWRKKTVWMLTEIDI